MAIARDACAAGTILAPKVTAPGLRIANPIPTNTAPMQIMGKLVVMPTIAGCHYKDGRPYGEPLEGFYHKAKHQPPYNPNYLHNGCHCPCRTGIPNPFSVNVHCNICIEGSNKNPCNQAEGAKINHAAGNSSGSTFFSLGRSFSLWHCQQDNDNDGQSIGLSRKVTYP